MDLHPVWMQQRCVRICCSVASSDVCWMRKTYVSNVRVLSEVPHATKAENVQSKGAFCMNKVGKFHKLLVWGIETADIEIVEDGPNLQIKQFRDHIFGGIMSSDNLIQQCLDCMGAEQCNIAAMWGFRGSTMIFGPHLWVF